ncbi:hypothetical protein [Pseudomonas sp. R16(2017)]|uniref:hypothetical protein n=1 Tax=Pseudomonas sp. R16(2017) TaxID=1981704 RepID=UPI000A1F32ED|nr:hypothetical protein [Pseudomonas sp. R16(2017)]
MNTHHNKTVRMTAWAAILGGVFAYLNVGLMAVATQGDMAVTLQGATMLALPAGSRQLFRLSMFADLLGFYLPLLAIGGHLWSQYRQQAGALGDMAALAITVYVTLGLVGACLQLAALNPLAQLHASGDPAAKAAAEAAWTAIATASQKGLWWCEGPVVLFWGLVVGAQLKRDGWSASQRWPLALVGVCFGLAFPVGFFPELDRLSYGLLVVIVAVFPLWMILFGARLLRRGELNAAQPLTAK